MDGCAALQRAGNSWMEKSVRNRIPFVAAALAAIVLGGCGSTKTTTTTTAKTAPLAPGATEIGTPPPVKSATYRANLAGTTGTPAGAPNGSGVAIITVKAPGRELCWEFLRLKNVASPTAARIYRSLAGGPPLSSGVPFGASYKASGCVSEPAVFLGLLGAHPQNFYVAIDNAQFPKGAVRGRP
jgi:CHRD domain